MLSLIPITIDSDGILSRWVLNGNAIDTYGSRNGTWTGTEKYIYDSEINSKVAYFNGSSYITASASGLPSGSSAYTLTCFFKAKSSDSFCPVSYGAAGTLSCNSFIHASGVLTSNHSSSSISSGIGVLSDGSWHHLASVYNGTTEIFYVDGVAYASQTYTLSISLTTCILGAFVDLTNKMSGYCADIRIYNTAKTAAQILSIAQLKS